MTRTASLPAAPVAGAATRSPRAGLGHLRARRAAARAAAGSASAAGTPSLGRLAATIMGIGFIGFGGGSALIPVLEENLVRRRRFITEDEFNRDVVIASITPGALPVEIAAGVGKQAHGAAGMVTAASAISLPGVLLTVIAVAVLSQFGDGIIRQVGFLSIGALAYILCVLARYAHTVIFKAKTNRLALLNALIALVVFALVGESAFVKLTGLAGILPSVHLGIIDVMAVTFFLVFWTQGRLTARRVIPGLAVAALYLLAADGAFGLGATPLAPVMATLMALGAIAGVRGQLSGPSPLRDTARLRTLGAELAAAAGLLLVLSIPALLLYSGTPAFVGRGVLSALASFGGGDAYLALADGLFVTAGFVLYVDFYNQLVPVANALPGSILCKVLAGMGFFAGYRATGDVAVGLAVALAGFSCSIALSSATFSVADFLYNGLERCRSFALLQKAICPIIVGLMGSVALNLIRSCSTVTVGAAPLWFAPALCLALAAVNLLVMRKTGNRALPMVLGMAGISCAVCNVLAVF